jgi:hypothetical protein
MIKLIGRIAEVGASSENLPQGNSLYNIYLKGVESLGPCIKAKQKVQPSSVSGFLVMILLVKRDDILMRTIILIIRTDIQLGGGGGAQICIK